MNESRSTASLCALQEADVVIAVLGGKNLNVDKPLVDALWNGRVFDRLFGVPECGGDVELIIVPNNLEKEISKAGPDSRCGGVHISRSGGSHLNVDTVCLAIDHCMHAPRPTQP